MLSHSNQYNLLHVTKQSIHNYDESDFFRYQVPLYTKYILLMPSEHGTGSQSNKAHGKNPMAMYAPINRKPPTGAG